MKTHPIATLVGGGRSLTGTQGFDGVVEIGLLLPAKRAEALMSLAKDRRESVGQILRNLIDRELSTTSAAKS